MSLSSNGKKFISPGAWFSMYYPSEWSEFEDREGSFLFYNPDNWNGNFRISAFKESGELPGAFKFGQRSVETELKDNPSATLIRIGSLECAYSKVMYQEEGEYYVSHIWIVGIENVAFECSFTVSKGNDISPAEQIITTLQIRKDEVKYPAEIIPIRLAEIFMLNESYEWVVSTVKKQLKKDFQGVEDDLSNIQQVIESSEIKPKQKDAWISFGIAVCVILANEVDGLEWKTLIDGNRETPVLQYRDSGNIIDPMRLVWSKVKAGERPDVVKAYGDVIESLAN